MARETLLDRVEQRRLDALRLGQRQAAGRQGRAGERPAPHRRHLAGGDDAMGAQRLVDRRAALRRDVAEQDVLARQQDRIAAEARDHLAQGGAQALARAVGDAPARHRQAEIEEPVALRVPAEMIDHGEARHGARVFQPLAEIGLELGLRPFLAALGDEVFEPRMLAVGAVAVIAVQADDGGGGGEKIVGRDEGDRRGQARKGFRLVVRHAEPAAEGEIIALEHAVLEPRDDRKIVGQNVDRIVLRHGEPDLELARQIGGAVERVLLDTGNLLAIEPDLVIGARRRQQVPRQAARIVVEPLMDRVADRRRHRRDIAHDVAAGGQGRDQRVVDRRDRLLEFGFDDAVELDGLPRGDAQRAVAVAVGDGVEREILRGAQPAAGQPRAHHQLMDLVAPDDLLAAAAAVVRLHRDHVLVEGRLAIGQTFGEVSAQSAAFILE